MRILSVAAIITCCVLASSYGEEAPYDLPMAVGGFEQQVHVAYTEAEGLPSKDVRRIACTQDGALHIETAQGAARFVDGRWDTQAAPSAFQEVPWYATLADHVGSKEAVRAVAEHDGELAVAAASACAREFPSCLRTTWALFTGTSPSRRGGEGVAGCAGPGMALLGGDYV